MEKITSVKLQQSEDDKMPRKNIPAEIVIYEEEGTAELAAELIFKYIGILNDPT